LNTAVLKLVEEALEILFVMAVGPAVAFRWISGIGEKRWTESVLESR